MANLAEFTLVFKNRRYAICKMPANAHFPEWAEDCELLAYIKTPDEITLVGDEGLIPPDVTRDHGWCAIFIDAVLEFDLVGVLASVLNPLAAAGISIYALSTYSTDYIMIRCEKKETAKQVLAEAGFKIATLE